MRTPLKVTLGLYGLIIRQSKGKVTVFFSLSERKTQQRIIIKSEGIIANHWVHVCVFPTATVSQRSDLVCLLCPGHEYVREQF